MKKFLKLLLCVLAFAFIFGATKVNATEKQFSQFYQEVERTDTVIYNTVTYTNIICNTMTTRAVGKEGGYGTEKACENNKWYGQQVNVLSVPRLVGLDGNQKYEVVAWSCFGDQEWDMTGVTAMAKDYEAKHPEYIVLGGVNGDFYDWHTTKDYPNCGSGVEVHDGDVLRANLNGGWGMVGMKNNNDADQTIFSQGSNSTNISANMYLAIYDENDNIIYETELDGNKGVNKETLSDGETSCYFGWLERIYAYDDQGNHILNSYGENLISRRDYHSTALPEGKKYIVVDGERVIYQKAEGTYFGKGVITNVDDLTEVPKNSFAVVTKNPEVEALLAEGVKIRCQFNLIGDFEEATDVLGCSHALVQNGVFCDEYTSEEYYTTRAPRTIVGNKADGTIVLLTMDGRQPEKNMYGTNQQEIDAILEELGVTDAYLMDGGGSSTFFVREDNGFVIKNSPSDGGQRSVSNGFLVVTKRDDTVKLSNIQPTIDGAQFTLDTKAIPENVKDCYIEVQGKKTKFTNGVAKVDGLTHNTSYNYTLYYETQSNDIIPTTTSAKFTTLKTTPQITFGEFRVTEDYVYPSITINDPDKAFQIVSCKLGNKTVFVDLDDPTAEIKIKRPNSDEEFTVTVTYSYRLGDGQELVEKVYTYEHSLPTQPEPETNKKGCGAGAIYISTMIAACGAVAILLKKNH